MPTPTLKVFISSTSLDLAPERKAVETALQRLGETAFVGMEYFGSREENTRRASLDEVDRSHVYVGIFAARYGSGITEAEYRRARARGLRCFIYFKDETTIKLVHAERDAGQMAKLDKLKAELRQAHTVPEFTSPDDLAARVTADLHRYILNNYTPPTPAAEAATSTIPALHQLPPPPGDFTGRAAELEELTANIERGVNISGLQGQGGIGKTALALKLAAQLSPRYPDAQFYLDLKGASEQQPVSVSDALAHVIRAYHPTAKLPDNEEDLSSLYRSVLHNQRALLLMDNAKDAQQVAPLIPPAGCVLLVTSRQHFTLPGLFPKNLDTLSPEDARKLLLTIAPRIGEQADEVAKLCGYLPLALRLTASAIAERVSLSVADYVRRLTDTQHRLKLIEASLSLSYDLINPDLQKQWAVLSVFPDTFDAAAAAAIWQIEPDAAQDVLDELFKYSLIDWNEAILRYSLHDLARIFANSRLSGDELDVVQARHATYYLEVFRQAGSLYFKGGESLLRGLALFNSEWMNIQVGQSWAAGHINDNNAAARLCSSYSVAGAHILIRRLYPREIINWLEKSLAAAQKLNDPEAEMISLNFLGLAYTASGEPSSAIRFLELALTIARRNDSQDFECALLGNLGRAYGSLDELQSAINFFEQSLDIARKMGRRRMVGTSLDNLGVAYNLLGQYERAIESFKQGLAIAREIGNWHGEGFTLRNMSKAFNQLGDRAQAIAHAEEALKIFEQLEDPTAVEVRELLNNLRRQK